MMKISTTLLSRAPALSLNRSTKLSSYFPNHHIHNQHLLPNNLVGPISCFWAHHSTTSANADGNLDKSPLPANLRQELMPRHVAIILDGNGRWAAKRGHGPEVGHDAGVIALIEVMGLCARWGIPVATFFVFSSENWRRTKAEVDFIMWRFQKMLEDELQNFIRQGIRIFTIGDTSTLPISLQEVLEHTKEATQDNTKTQVIFAISYSGKNDIVQACQNISKKVRNGVIEPNEVTENVIEKELETKVTSIPSPDLLIRTSGELRISNFLLWQLAYSEFYFCQTFWPDFSETQFIEALQCFQKRGRRFGKRI
ncbi:Dehydrodolichyl diphosphate synthase 2 [Bienertia sinuspersici]